jgi:hypothetical protein
MKQSKRELLAKVKLQENKIQVRLKKTIANNIVEPRLEIITKKFDLDTFEKKIILLLIGLFFFF